jgi:pheromone shutdown-related protein TraB
MIMDNDNSKRLNLSGKEIILVGTAHVSRDSVTEVDRVIRAEMPDTVCIELDEGRFASMTHKENWEKLDIVKALREGKGFLIIANLILGGFQRRMGDSLGVKPGEEMRAAVDTADALGIPHTLCDREVQVTLRRAWARCGFWGKCKLMAMLMGNAFSSEKLDEGEIERLKDRSALDTMFADLSDFLPPVKETLIDERDRYLAAKIWESPGSKLVAIVGAGHVPGLSAWLEKIAASPGEARQLCDVSEIEKIPAKSLLARAAPALIPLLIAALIALGFFRMGADVSLKMIAQWLVWNGGLAALGALLALAHPLAILAALVGAPVGTISPVLSVGMFSGVAQALLVRPRIHDAENLSSDVTSIRGVYRNRITRALLVFFLSSIGGMIGNIITIPTLVGKLSA